MDALQLKLENALSHAYEFERELTGGGMSRVFVALERALGRRVVIKVLPPELAAGVNTDRFRREIQLSAQLSHPHIVPMLAAGELDDLLYYTMPYIEGESVNKTLERQGRLDAKDVLRILHDVVDALAYAHSRGVIHRDIKPANILTLGNHFLVTDFGVAKAISVALPATGLTSGGFAIGTPAYMAPEQLAADPQADHRVDIYAIGLLAYELLTGASPFTGTSPQATMAAQLTRVPLPLHKVRPDVPGALSEIIQRCLEKLPENRPASAHELLRELDDLATPQGALKRRRPTLRAILANPAQHKRYMAAGIGLSALLAVAAFSITARVVDNARKTRDVPLSTDEAAERALLSGSGDELRLSLPAGSKVSTDLDAVAHATLLTRGAVAQTEEVLQVSQQLLDRLADSIYSHLLAEFKRDSAALSDSLGKAIKVMADSMVRVQLSLRGSGPRTGAGGGRLPSGVAIRFGGGQKRVLVLDFAQRSSQSDTVRVGREFADSLRAALTKVGGYTIIDQRMARMASRLDDPRAMADVIDAGAVLHGSIEPRRGDKVSVRVSISEPHRSQQPMPLGSALVPRDSIFSAVQALIQPTVEGLAKVAWPTGREGGSRRGGGAGRQGGGPRAGSASPPRAGATEPPPIIPPR